MVYVGTRRVDLEFPKLSDDEQSVVKEVTAFAGFIAVITKFVQIVYSKPRRKSLSEIDRERISELEDAVKILLGNLPEIRQSICEVREDNGWVTRQLTQMINLISEMRRESGQTRKTVDSILLMKHQESLHRSEMESALLSELAVHRAAELNKLQDIKSTVDRTEIKVDSENSDSVSPKTPQKS